MAWSYRAGVLLVALVLLSSAGSSVSAEPLMLRNESTTVVVNGGMANNGLIPEGGFFNYIDHAHNQEKTTWSVNPVLITGDRHRRIFDLATASRGGFGWPEKTEDDSLRCQVRAADIDIECRFELVGSNAKQTFRFRGSKLDGMTFLYYAENDLFGHSNDVASYTGSISDGDLALFMYDSQAGGLSVRLDGEAVANAELTLFGAGLWTHWGRSLERGDLSVLSDDGRNFVRVGDLGLALAFELSGSEAVVVINYDTQARPPYDPKSLQYLESGAIGSASSESRGYGSVSTESRGYGTPSTTETEPSELNSVRDWRLQNGQVIKGVLVGVVPRYKSLQIRLSTGRVLTVRLSKLSEADRQIAAPLFD